jgi:MFS family permease
MGLLNELGILTLYRSPLDTKILIALRFLRFFAFGGTTIILALYFHALGFSDAKIGLFMSLTLIGDAISFFLCILADGIGRRSILAIGACMFTFSGVVFALSGNYVLLVIAAVVGIISPNGREIGPFSAIEESTLACLTERERRGDVFAWYALIGSLGAAMGKFVTGHVVSWLELKLSEVGAYRVIFWAYAAIGTLSLALVGCLSSGVELHSTKEKDRTDERTVEVVLDQSEVEGEITPLLQAAKTQPSINITELPSVTPSEKRRLFPIITKESRSAVTKLCLLFALDSLASGLVPASWLTYFFSAKFLLTPQTLGTLFSIAALLSTLSTLVAASLCKRIGPINTMVFTHLPSAIFLSLIPLSPSLPLSIFFLFGRFSLASMDIAPKAAFISNILEPGERTAAMGFVNVVRTASQSLGPVMTGLSSVWWGKGGGVAFVVAGGLKASYDLGLLAMFGGTRGRKEEKGKRRYDEEGDEECEA